ncbi:MAG: Asp-tRNA(Asn)/Glu-tRNA(Gln) amidotransferase subunit GatC [Bdellovibrionaceae bacterium]|nr:Asp-tRNA(Asn)/Glu-tRNA(Gln) amidotransferase subunit GatC [Pseudobdellovibrionaceae bacterium]
MIDLKTVEHIARLARLEISDHEAQQFSEQLSKALNYFEQISVVKTEGVEPLVTPTEIEPYMREDIVIAETTAEEIVANAPDRQGNLFRVPPVV